MSKRGADARKGALGALVAGLTPIEASSSPAALEVEVERLSPGRGQPRRQFDETALLDLAASLRDRGVLQPLLVRPGADAESYEIVAGERRWRAAKLAGLARVPVLVRELTDEEARTAAAVENLQRADLNVIDEVDITVTLVGETLGLSAADVPSRLYALSNRPQEDSAAVELLEDLFSRLGRGSWSSFVRNKLRVLRWPEAVLTAMRRDGLGYSVAGVVAAAPKERQAELLRLALDGATKTQLREHLLTFRKGKPVDDATKVAAALRNRRRLEALPAKDRKRVEALLQELRRLLDE